MQSEDPNATSFPTEALLELQKALISTNRLREKPDIELVVSIESSDISARDFSSYLAFIDRTYGRLDPRGLRSYAQREAAHLKLTEIRGGSLELVITQLLESGSQVAHVVVLYLLLKYLPDFIKNLASAYRDIEEGKYTRARREKLREQLDGDQELTSLSEVQKEQLVGFLGELYVTESDSLTGAGRLSTRQVRDIRLRVVESRETVERPIVG